MMLDEDALIAAADLVGRSGAKGFEIGYLNDDVPIDEADWYCHAQYQGTRIIAEHHPGPVEAAEALARRILEGGKCTRCGGLISLSGKGAVFYPDAVMADGSRFTLQQAKASPQCRWSRQGRSWVAGCQAAAGRRS